MARCPRTCPWSHLTPWALWLAGWSDSVAQHSLRGDLWMLVATALYAVSNVAQEALLKGHTVTPAQWLAGLTLPAAAVSGTQHLLLERAHAEEGAGDAAPQVAALTLCAVPLPLSGTLSGCNQAGE